MVDEQYRQLRRQYRRYPWRRLYGVVRETLRRLVTGKREAGSGRFTAWILGQGLAKTLFSRQYLKVSPPGGEDFVWDLNSR